MTLNTKLGIICASLTVAASSVWLGVWWVGTQTPVVIAATDVERIATKTDNTNETVSAQESDYRRIDGVAVKDDALANLWPIGIMIENAAFGGVRPQSGLSAAQVVYELPVEGGITRFLALFAGDMPDTIGPVRSARPTYLEFNSEYDGLFGHAGGSPQALEAVDGLNIKDLSALGADHGYFYRETSLVAPHNLFTTGELLTQARVDKGLLAQTPLFESWDFKDDEPVAEPQLSPVSIDFGSGPLYAVDYTYNPATNSYDRKNGGEDHTDANTGKIISPKVVIIQLVPAGVSAGAEGRVNYDVTGTGQAIFLQDGQVIEGQWSKRDRTSRTIFRDAEGNRFNFNRGSIWISIVPATGTVTQ